MEINYLNIVGTIINIAILFAILLLIYKGTKGFKNFINRNKEMEKKIDLILNKLKDKEDKWCKGW